MEAAVSVEVVLQVAFPGRQVSPGRSGGEEEGKKDGDPQSSAGTLVTGRDTCAGQRKYVLLISIVRIRGKYILKQLHVIQRQCNVEY